MKLRSDTLVGKDHAGEDIFLPTLDWRSSADFLDDWARPLEELLPEDASFNGHESKHRLQTGLRAIVRHSAIICGLPAPEAGGEGLVALLDAILARVAAGEAWLPAGFYVPIAHMREWLGAAPSLEPLPLRPGDARIAVPAPEPLRLIEAAEVAVDIERPEPAVPPSPATRKRKLFYGWRASGEYRVSSVPPDGPVRPSVAFGSVADAEEWATRKRVELYWYPPLVGQ